MTRRSLFKLAIAPILAPVAAAYAKWVKDEPVPVSDDEFHRMAMNGGLSVAEPARVYANWVSMDDPRWRIIRVRRQKNGLTETIVVPADDPYWKNK